MTTMTETNPSLSSFILWKLNKAMANRANKRASSLPINAILLSIVRLSLHVAGFSLLTLAGFQWNIIAGLTVAALSCFALSTLMTFGKVEADATLTGR